MTQAKTYQEKPRQLCKSDQQDGKVHRRLVSGNGSSNFRGDKSEAVVAPDIDAPYDKELHSFGEHWPVCYMGTPVDDSDVTKNFDHRSRGHAGPNFLRS